MFWQVRAKNTSGITTVADNGTYGSFTVSLPPAAFTKTLPTVGQIITAPTTTLSWAASTGATGYEYCYAITQQACTDMTWQSTTATTAGITGLTNGTMYWQVRAINTSGTTYADNSTMRSFTVNLPPAAFAKTSPTVGQIITSPTTTLTWAASTGATSYEYCAAKTQLTCTSWKPTGTPTAIITGLTNGTMFWQVRAKNTSGITTVADNGTYGSFIVSLPPAAFTMVAPNDGTTIYRSFLSGYGLFVWNASQGATSYEYCIYLASGTCVWIDNGPAHEVKALLPDVNMTVPVFWQVRAKNSFGSTVSSSGIWLFYVSPQ
jgi:hypothetical protein